MIESIATALLIHFGQKTIDKFWGTKRDGSSTIIDQTGNLSYSRNDPITRRTAINRNFTTSHHQVYELLVGSLFLEDIVNESLEGNEIPIIFIFEETQQQYFLFDASLHHGYEIYLPPGIYSIFIFLVDSGAPSFFEAEIYAVGFPSNIDLSGADEVHYNDVNDIIDESPIYLARGRGPYLQDFILVDSRNIQDCPACFAELLES